jgi:hypothetical protein
MLQRERIKKKNRLFAEHVCAVHWASEDVGFFKNSAYSPVSSEVTFVAMSVLLLGIM